MTRRSEPVIRSALLLVVQISWKQKQKNRLVRHNLQTSAFDSVMDGPAQRKLCVRDFVCRLYYERLGATVQEPYECFKYWTRWIISTVSTGILTGVLISP